VGGGRGLAVVNWDVSFGGSIGGLGGWKLVVKIFYCRFLIVLKVRFSFFSHYDNLFILKINAQATE
jgi:hypothetical protein